MPPLVSEERGEPAVIPDRVDISLEELAALAQAGDKEKHFSELVERLRGRLHSFLLRRTGRVEDADDLVQETFLRAYARLDRYRPSWRFSTWIFTIASRLAANHQRSCRNRIRAEDAPAAPAADPAALVAERQESVELWTRAKAILSDAQYTVMWLHYARDMSVKEIAETTSRTAIHVRVLLYRARRKLAAEVACSAD